MKNALLYLNTTFHEMEQVNETRNLNKNLKDSFSLKVKYFILKKWSYILCFCLALTLSSSVFAGNLYVSGISGSESNANGIYIPDGLWNGILSWKHISKDYYIYSDGAGWLIGTYINDFDCLFFSSSPDHPSSPLVVTTWVESGALGAPTIVNYPSISFTTGSAFSPGNATANTNNNIIGRFFLSADITGATLTAATISVAGTNAGVTNLKLWSSSDATFNPSSDTQLNSQSDGPNVTFSGFNSSISTSGTYYFVTTDLALTANGSFTLSISSEANLTMNGGVIASSFSNTALTNSAISIIGIPTVTTTAASLIATTSATLGGNVTADGGATVSEHGVVYSLTDATPTIAESANKIAIGSGGTGSFSQSVGSLTPNTLYYYNAYAINTAGTSYGTAGSFTTLMPAITSATYNAGTGVLVLTCTNINTGDIIDPSKITITGECNATYVLTSSSVTASSSTSASITLNGTDKAAVNLVINMDGLSSKNGTTYNLAAADDWDSNITSGNTADPTNAITVNNVAIPQITSATYDANTGVLVVTGTGFLKSCGATNDIDVFKLTFKGEGGSTYTLISTGNVEITSATVFTVTLSVTDKSAVNLILNKNGTSSTDATTYNLAAADHWAQGAYGAINVMDLTGNSINVSNVVNPAITGTTYNATTGALVITGTGFTAKSGATNDIVANKFTITGEGGATYTLTDTPNVEITSGTSFTITLSSTDKTAVNLIINKNGTSSTGATTYNLAAAEDWAAGADAGLTIVDQIGNGITVSNVAVPTITSATYDAATGAMIVTGSGFLKLNGSTNDIVANKLTIKGEGGVIYTLTDSPNVEITSGTAFTVTLSATDKAAVNQLLNKNGTSSTGATTYNLAAAEDWDAGADAGSTITADLTGNGITVSNLATPTISTQPVTNISITTATGNGNITSIGVPNPTQYGVVWSTSTGPTISLSTKTTQGAVSTPAAFTSNITGLTGHTLYYVKAYATNSAGTSYGTEVSFTTDPVQTTISGGGNWSTAVKDNGDPGTSSNVMIGAGTISVDGNYHVHNATLNSDGALNIGQGTSLIIDGDLTLTSDGANTSSLIITGTGALTVHGTIKVKRYMSGNRWYMISPTASGQSVVNFLAANTNIPTNSSTPPQHAMMEYNTSTNSWHDFYTDGSILGNMDAGKGYAARITSDGYINFVGNLSFGNNSVSVTCSGDNGWNCIGNPYTSAIHVNANSNGSNNFITVNQSLLDPSYAAVYVWDESGTYNGSQNFYKVINNVEFTIPKTTLGQDKVQMGQGFFVKVLNTTSEVLFNPEMQVHKNDLPLKTTRISWPAVGLTVKTDSLNASTYVAYNERMTTGLDPTYDAGLIRGTNKLAVYSHLVKDNGIDFTIQCLPDKQIKNSVIPIGVDYTKGGEIKISAQSVELPSGTNIILEDKLCKSFTTLSEGAEYKATVDPNTKGIGRFYLHTTGLTNYELKTAIITGKLNAYANTNKEIRIIGEVSSNAIATLYDLQGKILWIVNLKESNLNVIPASNIKTGIYMLSVRDKNKSQAFKLFIKD